MSSDDYARFRLESAVVKFMYSMAHSEGVTSGHNLTTSKGVWSLLIPLLEEAAVIFDEFVAHPHTLWGVLPAGWPSVIPAKRVGGKGGGGALAEPAATGGGVKTEKDAAKKRKAEEGKKKELPKVKKEKKDTSGKGGGGVGAAEAKEGEDDDGEEAQGGRDAREKKGKAYPCYYGIMALRGVKDSSSKETVICHRHAHGESKAGKCFRCRSTDITDIKNMPRDKEETALREYEEKAKDASSTLVQNLAVAWRKAAGKA